MFISRLIDTLEATYNVDRRRVYANGMSHGGGMAFALSCTLSNRIAAIGAVSAAQSLPWSWCRDTTPVPMIAFHCTGDHIVPYDGGNVWISPRPFPSVRTWALQWARRDRCAEEHTTDVAATVVRTAYAGCAGASAVELYTIRGGGHQWPGGEALPAWMGVEMRLFGLPVGEKSDAIDATRTMWSFFEAHPLGGAP